MEEQAATSSPALNTAIVPLSTYRVQFHAGFTFKDATAAVPYWKSLGISHLYASPYLKARKGSTHGYDVVDHNALNPEVGSQADFDELCNTLAKHGMQQLVDIVPNHMGVLEADNTWWLDVMEHGERSPYAEWFDIDWNSSVAGLKGKVLVGLLGDQYGEVLENGDLVLGFNAATGGFSITYFEHCFPIDPACTVAILHAAPMPSEATAYDREPLRKLIDEFAGLALPPSPPSPGLTPVQAPPQRPRSETAIALRQKLVEWVQHTPWAPAWIETCLAAVNGTPGEPASFDKLDQLLRSQSWRIAHWRTTGHEVNYRRFFDVNTLAAVRNERLEVFEETHRTILKWVDEGRIAGLRIDHPDGLSDPVTYLQRLQARHVEAQQKRGIEDPKALYVVVEKILADDEIMPGNWQTQGDTGYHYSNQVNGVFVDTSAKSAFNELYDGFVGHTVDYDITLHTAKHTVMGTSLAADLELLTDALYAIARGDRRTCDFTRSALRDSLAEMAASFPVYRTYLGAGTHGGVDPFSAREPTSVDRAYVEQAVEAARKYALGSAVRGIEYLRDVLLNAHAEPDLARRKTLLQFATRWQQFTSPVMAKAMEDTTFYRYLRLLSLNDVGGDPRTFGMTAEAFHRANEERLSLTPHTILGTSTHDSKRSEDVRARLDVLSEMPEHWAAAIQNWRAINEPLATAVDTMDSNRAPTPDHEYLLYQTLVGAWPMQTMDADAREDFRKRIQAYMLKATREAKDATAWMEPHEAYEQALAAFIDGALESAEFTQSIEAFVRSIAPFGAFNSLGVVALKLTSPGVPDVYQGCETWNLSLVDPDNRRHIDLASLAKTLHEMQEATQFDSSPSHLHALTESWQDGRIKLFVTWRLMSLRNEKPALFGDGGYQPLKAEGTAAEHVLAYMRQDLTQPQGDGAITIVGRLLHRLSEGEATAVISGAVWADTRIALPEGTQASQWRDAITGKLVDASPSADGGVASLKLSDVLGEGMTVAVLVRA